MNNLKTYTVTVTRIDTINTIVNGKVTDAKFKISIK